MRQCVSLILFLLWSAVLCAADAIGWGVVCAYEAAAYDKTGAQVFTLPGGTGFDILKELKVDNAPAYLIETLGERKRKCVIAAEGTRVFLEFPAADDAEGLAGIRAIQRALEEYYKTLTMRQAMLERARDQHLAASPARKLKQLRADLAAIPAKDRAAEKAQQAATSNAERLRYQDLRKELRFRATGLQQEIKRLEAEAETWERQHPFNDKAIRTKAVWRRLTARLREMEGALALYGVTPADE